MELLYNPDIVKVFHSADQDLEIFFHLRDELPAPVFDTQLAAALLGHGEQIGYANLVKALLNHNLDKSQTRTDWSKRPLSGRQIDYALDDVRYLRIVYETLRDELTKRGRLNWLDNDVARLTNPDTYRVDQDTVWQRIKGASRLKGVRLNVLKHLARWREQRAIQTNKPRKWVLSDNVLLDLATQLPKTPEHLQNIRSLDSQTASSLGATLLELIDAARNEPEALWPKIHIPPKPTAAEEAKADLIMSLLHKQAALHDLSPGLFSTRADIQRLVRGKRDIPLVSGWRRELAGEMALEILEGRKVLACEGDEVIIKPNSSS
jgi:ribonuclease D